MSDTIPQTVVFPDLFDKPLVATFDQQHASSDGGAILLKAAEARYGVIDGFARCLVDERQPGKIRHPLRDLLAQRIFGSVCGHPDANDADRLAEDPIHKLLLGLVRRRLRTVQSSIRAMPQELQTLPEQRARLTRARAPHLLVSIAVCSVTVPR